MPGRIPQRIAELEADNAALRNQVRDLELGTKARDAFLARVSHELRIPLASILGYADTLLMGLYGALNGEQTRHVATIQRNSEHLLSLVNDLLDLAKVGTGTSTLESVPVPCVAALEEVRAALLPLAVRKGIELRVDPVDPALAFMADARAVHQILLNLVSNAIRSTDTGYVQVAHARCDNNGHPGLCIQVRDTGCGIRAEDLDKLFRPFSKIHNNDESQTEHQGKRTGLGLHLSRTLAQRMGGNIRVTSEYGAGSVFTLVLPIVG